MFTRLFRMLHDLKTSSSTLPVLGRWCHMDKSKNGWKVDMANTDHCGTCSYDAPKTISEIKNTIKNVKQLDTKMPKGNTVL